MKSSDKGDKGNEKKKKSKTGVKKQKSSERAQIPLKNVSIYQVKITVVFKELQYDLCKNSIHLVLGYPRNTFVFISFRIKDGAYFLKDKIGRTGFCVRIQSLG